MRVQVAANIGRPVAVGEAAADVRRGRSRPWRAIVHGRRRLTAEAPDGRLQASGPARRSGVGLRHARWWPEARLRLPDTAVYWYGVESIFRRGALWRSLAVVEEVTELARAAARDAWPELRELRRNRMVVFSHEAGGLTTYVKVVGLDDGRVILSLGQKARRLRFEDAERALGGGGGGRILPPDRAAGD